MNPEIPAQDDSLSLSAANRIDEACLRFEAAWRAGQSPQLEDFLGKANGPERETLRWQLLRIESGIHSFSIPIFPHSRNPPPI